ncbi:hypothetical protein P5673_022911 [Acropora cervicornis]|uniref:Uncharacterized protein n=1 Tax=Acropora cervicornis TaxID=6130 RepID=A0AAD9UZB5_ACRCE|nr:hypothetical protein P5673_022911 [Acropora cervicornis]
MSNLPKNSPDVLCVENGRGQKSTQVTPFTVFSAIAAVLKRNDRTIFVVMFGLHRSCAENY